MSPFLYNQQNFYNTRVGQPTVHAAGTQLVEMFKRYLYADMIGVIEWDMPDYWSYDYFTYTLYWYGYIAIIRTDKFGVIPQMCSPYGYNVFYEPTHVIINNPLLSGMTTPAIGTQCAVIRLMADWCGMDDIVGYYAQLMATTCSAVGVNLINSKLAYVLFANTTAGSATLKEMYSKIASGEPAVCVDKDVINIDGTPSWQLFDLNVSNHYITDKLLVDLEKIRNMFRTHVGIPNSNTEKKERQIVDEVNSNNTATRMLTDSMLSRIQKGLDMTHKLFKDVKLTAKWRFNPDEEIEDNDNSNVQPKQKSV